MKNQIIANCGSIQNIPMIPDDIKAIYKTVWEISQKVVLNMAADRGAFIDQSQSLNMHIEKPSYGIMSSVHFYGWRKGLKTGMYYLRTKPAAKPIQFTVDKQKLIVKDQKNTTTQTNGDLNGVSKVDSNGTKDGTEDIAKKTVNGDENDVNELTNGLKNSVKISSELVGA